MMYKVAGTPPTKEIDKDSIVIELLKVFTFGDSKINIYSKHSNKGRDVVESSSHQELSDTPRVGTNRFNTLNIRRLILNHLVYYPTIIEIKVL